MYKVGIIGLGSIASRYGTFEEKAPYTHAGGILHSKRVELTAVADLSEKCRTAFHDKWDKGFPRVKTYTSAAEMLAAEKLDIVAVCVRGPFHHQVMMEVLQSNPKAIFLEKPPTCSLAEMDEMVSAAKARNIPITVSYSRHWAPHILRMQQLITQEGLIGKVKMVVGYCGGSFLSFASHTTDLICQFAGYCPTAIMARGHVDPNAKVPEGFEPEPAIDGMLLEFANGVNGIQVGGDGEHGGFYCDITGTEGRARVGMYIPPAAWGPKKAPIDLTPHNIPENESVFKMAYDQIAAHLDGGPLPDCTNDAFVAVHETGFAAIESVLTGRRITIPNQNRTRKVYANG